MRAALNRASGRMAEFAGKRVRVLPGLLALGAAVAGSWVIWGLGVALLVATPFLLALDRRV